MYKMTVLVFTLATLFILNGCAPMTNPQFESPVVSLYSFKMLSQDRVTPTFEVGLRIINPNREPLNFEGIFYTIEIEGYKILAGVSNDLPVVDPYGEATLTLEASVDLIRGIKLISSLMQEPRDTFVYSFNAKLDPGGFSPKILIQEKGEFSLNADI